jgi:hypothetical protein
MFSGDPTPGMLRVYRRNSAERVFACVWTAASLAFSLGFWYQIIAGTRTATLLSIVGSFTFVLFGVLLTVSSFKKSISLTGDAIQYQSVTATLVLPYERIKGRRKYLDKGDSEGGPVTHLVVVSNDDNYPKLDFEEAYEFDYFFYCWFDALPDLDESDKPDRSHRISD